MDTESLLHEIESEFPLVEMPPDIELSFHKIDCAQCEYLRNDLSEYRNKEITGKEIRSIHQEMSCLSAKAWRWILPHYLKFCLTPEAAYNTMETEFLIYNLGPDLKYQKDTLQRLSQLSKNQISCLIHFLDWCSNQYPWKDYCPEDIAKARSFLCTVMA